jgi:hypothetical protein
MTSYLLLEIKTFNVIENVSLRSERTVSWDDLYICSLCGFETKHESLALFNVWMETRHLHEVQYFVVCKPRRHFRRSFFTSAETSGNSISTNQNVTPKNCELTRGILAGNAWDIRGIFTRQKNANDNNNRRNIYSPSRRREAPCEGTNSPAIYTRGNESISQV